MIADENDDPVAAISSFSDYSIVVFSIPELKKKDYPNSIPREVFPSSIICFVFIFVTPF